VVGEKSFRLEIFLVALAAILLEIAFTRIFSYKLYYYFTYLILGLALLGLGSGGIFVSLSGRLRRAAPEKVVSLCCLAAGLVTPLSYLVVARIQVSTQDLLTGVAPLAALACICLALFAPFLLVGISLATILGARSGDVARLYSADLVGAGIGCALAVPLFTSVGPPGAVFVAGGLLAASGARLAHNESRLGVWGGAALAVLLLALAAMPGLAPEPVPDRMKTMSPQRLGGGQVLFSSWSPLFRIDVIDGLAPDRFYQVIHDGIDGSIIVNAEQGVESAPVIDGGIRAAVLDAFPRGGRILIIGAAGGHEILTALRHGAGEIVGVELNPVTVSLLRGPFADYSGNIASHPKVTLVTGEGRSFVKRDDSGYDLVWFVAPDSYSALNAASSGAFVLSESYLYTVEMIEEALTRLNPGGWICVQFGEIDFENKPNRTTRYLSTAREALRRAGIDDFASHVMVATAPGIFTTATVLLKAEPFTPDEIARFEESVARIEKGRIIHAGAEAVPAGSHPTQQVVRLPEARLERWRDAYPYELSPVTDDSPFFWHFARFRDAVVRPWGKQSFIPDPEDATGERTLLILLAFATVFAAAFLLLPLVFVRETWQLIPHKRNAFCYFAALGLGFMFFEVCLIQKLTLFLGYPTYSLTVTLFSLLIFSGLGSLLSSRWQGPPSRVLYRLLGALLVLTLFYQFGPDVLVDHFVGLPLPLRLAIGVAILAPLGLCLGAFMPLGLGLLPALSSHDREYVAWAWAVNGFFSVVASVLATLLAMAWGFRAVLLLAGLVYALGVLAFVRIPQARER